MKTANTPITITSQNIDIDKIFRGVIKSLERAGMPKNPLGYFFTPYGWVVYDRKKLFGSKRAIKWLKIK